MDAASEQLAEIVRAAAASGQRLRIRAGGTKDFYGNIPTGELLDVRAVRGVVMHDPGELVLTARAGTPLAEVEARLDACGQMLAFEPPHFGPDATIGGCVAAGLAGPRSASTGPVRGPVRDFVLGAKIIDGRGRLLKFGGTVIKNVAGFDVSRVLAGSLGILGVIVELSLKVVPRPPLEETLRFECEERRALSLLADWGRRSLPISGSGWCGGMLTLRLSGAVAAVDAARARLGGERLAPADAGAFWRGLREQELEFFAGDAPLWRMSLPATAPADGSADARLIEWGGALRWLRSDRDPADLRRQAAAAGGHATLFRGGDRSQAVFPALPAPLAAIHAALKREFDPGGILNAGRLVPGL